VYGSHISYQNTQFYPAKLLPLLALPSAAIVAGVSQELL